MHTFIRLVLALGLVLPCTCSWGQTYPGKPVRLVIPYAPGGGAELQARFVTAKLAEIWGQPVIIENKPGGGTTIAGAYVAKTAPDGYTILSSYSSLLTAALTMKDLPFDVIKSFTAVSWLTEVPSILVVPGGSAVITVRDLLELAKKAPKQLSYGSTVLAGSQHLNAEMVLLAAHAKAVHVPYKGTAEAGTALLGQQIDFAFVDQSIRQLMKTGKVRALAVTSTKRWSALPDVPTLQESIGVAGVSTRNLYLVPAATPMSVVNQINTAVVRALRSPDLEEKMTAAGYNIVASTQEEAARFFLAEYATYDKLVRQLGLTAE